MTSAFNVIEEFIIRLLKFVRRILVIIRKKLRGYFYKTFTPQLIMVMLPSIYAVPCAKATYNTWEEYYDNGQLRSKTTFNKDGVRIY